MTRMPYPDPASLPPDDRALLDFVNDHRIPLEICLSSDLAAGAVPTVAEPVVNPLVAEPVVLASQVALADASLAVALALADVRLSVPLSLSPSTGSPPQARP